MSRLNFRVLSFHLKTENKQQLGLGRTYTESCSSAVAEFWQLVCCEVITAVVPYIIEMFFVLPMTLQQPADSAI